MNQLQMWHEIRDRAVRNGYQLRMNAPVFERGDHINMDSFLATMVNPEFLYALFGEEPTGTKLLYTPDLEEFLLPHWMLQGHIALTAYHAGKDPVKHLYEQVTKL